MKQRLLTAMLTLLTFTCVTNAQDDSKTEQKTALQQKRQNRKSKHNAELSKKNVAKSQRQAKKSAAKNEQHVRKTRNKADHARRNATMAKTQTEPTATFDLSKSRDDKCDRQNSHSKSNLLANEECPSTW